MRRVRTHGGGGAPARPRPDLADYSAALDAAAGDVAAVAEALVEHALASTSARSASLFELRGGRWDRIAARGIAPDGGSFVLPLSDLPTLPVLVSEESGIRRLRVIARLFDTSRYAVVPLQWPANPAVLLVSYPDKAATPDPIGVLSMLAIGAGAAAGRREPCGEQIHAGPASGEAQHDPLTSLANRARFNDVLREALRTAAAGGSRCAVLFLDLDGFKYVNDSLGHAAGDRILVAVAERLRHVIPDACTVARLGGDEFVVLVERADLPYLHRLADGIDAAMHAPFSLDDGEFFLSAAVGIALSDGEGNEPSALIRDADAAMYAAKRHGPGRRAVFDDELRSREQARVALEGELRQAVRDDSIDVVYQPILDLRTKRWCGVEALVRWENGPSGEDSAEGFVALAEELGLVGRLGEQVLRRVLAQASAWQQAGIGVPISVNISPTQLTDPAIVDEILAALRHSSVAPGRIELEITESAVVESPEVARRLLVELHDAGVRAFLDDFGTGHSSIARLADLPVSGVKIDRRFLAPLGDDAAAISIMAAVIDLAHALGLTVTAEGVETREALAALQQLGCDQAQGYLIGRPSSADAVADLLALAPAVAEPPATPAPRRPARSAAARRSSPS